MKTIREEIIERLTNDIKENKELLYAIANFVCCKECENVEFVELYLNDKMYVTLILVVDDDKISVQFVL